MGYREGISSLSKKGQRMLSLTDVGSDSPDTLLNKNNTGRVISVGATSALARVSTSLATFLI